MKNNWIVILIIIAVFGLLIGFRKPIKKLMTRGYANKNPGNIRLTTDIWQGEVKGKDKDFKTFKSMAFGYRALFVNIRTYINVHQLNTIRKIISRYAPTNENDTTAYIKSVVAQTGIRPDDRINVNDEVQMKKLITAISRQENGISANPNEVNEGYNLFKTS